MGDIFVAAMSGSLGASLSIAELSRLRASSWDGTDQQLFERLLRATTNRIAAGQVECTLKQCQRFTGEYLARRPYDPNRDSPLERGKVKEWCTTQKIQPQGVSLEPTYETWPEQRFTREQAQALFSVDPDDWSEGALKWAGINELPAKSIATQTHTLSDKAGDAPLVDSQARAICEDLGVDYLDSRSKPMLRTLVESKLLQFGISQTSLDATFNHLERAVEARERNGLYLIGPTLAYILSRKGGGRQPERHLPYAVSSGKH